jgi:hypothetical protein
VPTIGPVELILLDVKRVARLSEIMVRAHFVTLAAFLLQPHPPALPIGKIVLDTHDRGADAREGIDHDADQRAVFWGDRTDSSFTSTATHLAGGCVRRRPVADGADPAVITYLPFSSPFRDSEIFSLCELAHNGSSALALYCATQNQW